MCKCFSAVCVGIGFVHLRPSACGAMYKCFSAVGMGTVFEPL